MNKLKIPLAAMILVMIMAGVSSAQLPPYVDCINEYKNCQTGISESSLDTMRLVHFEGRPGDTVWLPVYLKTTTDTVSAFNTFVKYDPTILTPVKAIEGPPDPQHPEDSLYVKFELLGGLLAAQQRYWEQSPGDAIFSAGISTSPFDSGAIFCGFNLTPPEGQGVQRERLMPAGEVIFRLAFEVDPLAADNAIAQFELYDVNEWVLVDTNHQEYWCGNCRRTDLSVDRTTTRPICVDWDTLIDTITGGGGTIIDTTIYCVEYVDSVVTDNYTLYPWTTDGTFQVNLVPPPQIATFFAPDPDDSVGIGVDFALQWSVSNADSITIWQGANFLYTSHELSTYTFVTSPATAGTYPYTLWAFNQYDSVSATVTMKVGGTTPPPTDAPVITVQSAFSVDVGNTLNFTVGATDPNGDFITLQATNLPAGATFPTATGTGSASSSFSWTPGINQDGGHVATFRATDNGGLFDQESVSIVVNAPQFDILFTSSVEGSAVGGLPGKTGLSFPINLVTSQIVYGVQFDFVYDPVNFEVTGVDVTENTAEYVVYENIGVHPGEVRFVAFGMANEPIGSDGTEILLVRMDVDPDAAPGLYPIYIEDAWESVNPDPGFPALPLMSDSGIIQVDALGDVNLDTRINVADLVSIVGYIIGDFTLDQRRFDNADVITNAAVNVFDLVAIVSLIYGLPVSPAPGQILDDLYATISLDYNDLRAGDRDVMTIRSEMPVDIAGVEMEVLYDPAAVKLGVPELTKDVAHLQMRSHDDGQGRLKILMYFSNPFEANQLISVGRNDLIQIPLTALNRVRFGDKSQLVLENALLSTAGAVAVKVEGLNPMLPNSFNLSQNYPNPFNPTTTIEFTLGAPGGSGAYEAQLDIFNILGQNVKTLLNGNLPAGNHQVIWDGSDHSGKRVASGIYLYKLQVGQESQTKKMVLLK
ncbi:MAG: cohesin domain-containing protein [bacterium]